VTMKSSDTFLKKFQIKMTAVEVVWKVAYYYIMWFNNTLFTFCYLPLCYIHDNISPCTGIKGNILMVKLGHNITVIIHFREFRIYVISSLSAWWQGGVEVVLIL